MIEMRITVRTFRGNKKSDRKLHQNFRKHFPGEETLVFLDSAHSSFLVFTDRITFVQKDFKLDSMSFRRFVDAVSTASRDVEVLCDIGDDAPLYIKAQVASLLPCRVESYSTGEIQNEFSHGQQLEYVEADGCIAAKTATLDTLAGLLEHHPDVSAFVRSIPTDKFTSVLTSSVLHAFSTVLPTGESVVVLGPPVCSGFCCYIRGAEFNEQMADIVHTETPAITTM